MGDGDTNDEARVACEIADYLVSQVHLTSSKLGTVTYRPAKRPGRVRVSVQSVKTFEGGHFLIEERTYDVALYVTRCAPSIPPPSKPNPP